MLDYLTNINTLPPALLRYLENLSVTSATHVADSPEPPSFPGAQRASHWSAPASSSSQSVTSATHVADNTDLTAVAAEMRALIKADFHVPQLARRGDKADTEVESKKAKAKLGQWVRLHDYNIAGTLGGEDTRTESFLRGILCRVPIGRMDHPCNKWRAIARLAPRWRRNRSC